MKIKSIETFILNDKLSEAFYFSQWDYAERKICIVRITSESGHVGYGEGYGPAHLIKTGIEHLTPFVVGQDPLQTETIWSIMYRRTLDFSRRGVLMGSISAIDVALWDLKGKILEQPVHLMLGGKKRDTITPYATGLYFTHGGVMADKLAEEAKMYVEQGYKAMKMKVGLDIETDLENIKKIREAIGYDVALMMDANHAYNLREAVILAQEAEQYKIGWFEEPVSPEFYDQYAELRTKTNIPISGGECEYTRYGFQTLLKNNCVDIAQPDICASGGLTEAKRIATLTSVYGVDLVPHTWGTSIAISAAIHLVANLETVPGRLWTPDAMIEYDRTENALRKELVTTKMVAKNGIIEISNDPGLGFEFNEDALEKYRMKE